MTYLRKWTWGLARPSPRDHPPKDDLLEEVEPHGVSAIRAHQRCRVQHVPKGLAHLEPVLGQEAVAVHGARQRQARAQQHRRPIDCVEAQDVLGGRQGGEGGRSEGGRGVRHGLRSIASQQVCVERRAS
eukprot:365756-Chlamydomonas_euryale.AAC.21